MALVLFILSLVLLCTQFVFARSTRETCKPGTVRDGRTCVPCPPGTYSDRFNSSKCSQCQPGRFRALAGAFSLQQCIQCPAGSSAPNPGSSMCQKCPPGTDSLPGSRFCGACRPGTELYTGDKPCKKCYPDLFSNETTNKFCKRCPDGTISVSTKECQKCPPGMYKRNPAFEFDPISIFLNNECIPCQKGTFNDVAGARSCRLCPPGTFSKSRATSCTPCPRGQFNNRILATRCRPCPSGKVTVGKGAAACKDPKRGCTFDTFENDDGECMACLPGERLDIVKKRCVPCRKNEVSNGGVDTKCRKCPRNKIPLGDLTRFEKAGCMCKPGFIDDLEGGCFPCPAGTFWENGNSFFLTTDNFTRTFEEDAISGTCIPCRVGAFSNRPGMTSCTKCPEGSFQSHEGGTSCELCPPGSRSTRILGDFEDTGPLRCITDEFACKPGEVRTIQDKCVAISCPFENTLLDRNRCVGNCAKGYRIQGRRCKRCKRREISPGGLSRKCTPCPKRQIRNAIGDGCICDFEFGFLKGTCTRCPPGTERMSIGIGSDIVSQKCVPCPEGTANNNENEDHNYCRSCFERGFTLGPGARMCTPCPKGTRRFEDLFGRLSGNCRSRDPYA